MYYISKLKYYNIFIIIIYKKYLKYLNISDWRNKNYLSNIIPLHLIKTKFKDLTYKQLKLKGFPFEKYNDR